MTDLRLQNRIGQDDREALEHIARALEGRVWQSWKRRRNGEANGRTAPETPAGASARRTGPAPRRRSTPLASGP
ncbi:hypothetical protein AUC68_03190 [Methyloceanibacter methanicus]|uniref:Uncharacterized protein n=1 Tax=Methyloceanibacter methanicus TaxID=1774968 RepID=A0A1E3W2X2_9HYPH|nr:hypothetical protein AUC68_03190 [Methyloceanibacter methanicus]